MFRPPLSKHAESDIELIPVAGKNWIVRKTYRQDAPCISWLNRHLSQFYDPAVAMPVAQHEHAALELLSAHSIAPRPIELRIDGVVMEYAGVSLEYSRAINQTTYRQQCLSILELLTRLRFRHNDMLRRNVLVTSRTVKLVDFTLSEFRGVSILEQLPDSNWARPGKDGDLPDLYPSRMDVIRCKLKVITRGSPVFRAVRGALKPYRKQEDV